MTLGRLINPRSQYFDDAGDPLAFGKMFIKESGSATDKDLFFDSGFSIAAPNPVTLSGSGRLPNTFFKGSARGILTDSNNVQFWDIDPIFSTSSDQGGFQDWNAITTWEIPDYVIGPDDNIYCSFVNNNQGNDPTLVGSDAFWELVEFTGTWNPNITYITTDIVKDPTTGIIYRSLTDSNTNNNPATDSTNWGSSADPSRIAITGLNVGTATASQQIRINSAGDAVIGVDQGISDLIADAIEALQITDNIEIKSTTSADTFFFLIDETESTFRIVAFIPTATATGLLIGINFGSGVVTTGTPVAAGDIDPMGFLKVAKFSASRLVYHFSTDQLAVIDYASFPELTVGSAVSLTNADVNTTIASSGTTYGLAIDRTATANVEVFDIALSGTTITIGAATTLGNVPATTSEALEYDSTSDTFLSVLFGSAVVSAEAIKTDGSTVTTSATVATTLTTSDEFQKVETRTYLTQEFTSTTTIGTSIIEFSVNTSLTAPTISSQTQTGMTVTSLTFPLLVKTKATDKYLLIPASTSTTGSLTYTGTHSLVDINAKTIVDARNGNTVTDKLSDQLATTNAPTQFIDMTGQTNDIFGFITTNNGGVATIKVNATTGLYDDVGVIHYNDNEVSLFDFVGEYYFQFGTGSGGVTASYKLTNDLSFEFDTFGFGEGSVQIDDTRVVKTVSAGTNSMGVTYMKGVTGVIAIPYFNAQVGNLVRVTGSSFFFYDKNIEPFPQLFRVKPGIV